MAAITMEWSILERLLLAQAVNKYGDDDWIQVARTLKQHPLLQSSTRPEAFNQKNCSLQYYLMLENMETERRQPKTSSAMISQDMPNVVKLARQLYFQRVEELKQSIKNDQDQFMTILSEIDDIKSGAWDSKLSAETSSSLSPMETLDNLAGTTDDDTQELSTQSNIGSTTTDVEMESATSNTTVQQEQHDDDQIPYIIYTTIMKTPQYDQATLTHSRNNDSSPSKSTDHRGSLKTIPASPSKETQTPYLVLLVEQNRYFQ